MISAYRKVLTGDDKVKAAKAAKAWTAWEMATAKLMVSQSNVNRAYGDSFAE